MNQPTTLNDVIGMDEAKAVLKERLHDYYKYKDQIEEMGLKPSKGILIYGFPGTGKTMLINAAIHELIESNPNIECKIITLSDVSSSQVGLSDKKITSLFRSFPECKETVLVFDEADIIIPNRARTSSVLTIERVNAILRELDGLNGNRRVFVIASTNRPFDVDRAFVRSGRIDYCIYAELPTIEQRKELIIKYFGKIPSIHLTQEVVSNIAEHTQNFTGSDYAAISTLLAFVHLKEIEKNPRYIMTNKTIVEQISKKRLRTDIIKMGRDYSRFISDKNPFIQ